MNPLLEELQKLLETMDVPLYRKGNLGWLNRNLFIRNGKHRDFNRANEIIQTLLKQEGITPIDMK